MTYVWIAIRRVRWYRGECHCGAVVRHNDWQTGAPQHCHVCGSHVFTSPTDHFDYWWQPVDAEDGFYDPSADMFATAEATIADARSRGETDIRIDPVVW